MTTNNAVLEIKEVDASQVSGKGSIMLTSTERKEYSDLLASHGVCYCADRDQTDQELVFNVFPFQGNSTVSPWYLEMVSRGLAQ